VATPLGAAFHAEEKLARTTPARVRNSTAQQVMTPAPPPPINSLLGW